jgi:hypothetical protein
VGLSQLHAVISHLRLALLHDLKAEAWPLSRDVPHWRAEARGHRGDACQHFTPSMTRRLDVEKLYRQARRRMPETIDGTLPLPVAVAQSGPRARPEEQETACRPPRSGICGRACPPRRIL